MLGDLSKKKGPLVLVLCGTLSRIIAFRVIFKVFMHQFEPSNREGYGEYPWVLSRLWGLFLFLLALFPKPCGHKRYLFDVVFSLL